MIKLIKIIAAVLSVGLLLFILGFIYLIYGMFIDERNSQLGRLFWTIGEHAYLLDRIGTVGIPKNQMPDITIERGTIPEDLEIDCSAKIIAPHIGDPRRVAAVDSSTQHYRNLYDILRNPEKALFIYNGPAVDFSEFFNVPEIPEYVYGQLYFFPMSFEHDIPEGERSQQKGDDVSDLYAEYIFGKEYAWETQECENFTYTIVRRVK